MWLKKSVCGLAHSVQFIRKKSFTPPKVDYRQGQIIERNIREYFYYIDFEGRLFLDDLKTKNFTTCLRDTQFLKFFFQRLKLNETTRYQQEFPFLMLCGRERNFVRCEDTPIVFTQYLPGCGVEQLAYNNNGALHTVDFHPSNFYVNPASGRLYHPAWEKVGHIGLVSSALSHQFADGFMWAQGGHSAPTHFTWKGERMNLDTSWTKCARFHGMRSVPPGLVSCNVHQ